LPLKPAINTVVPSLVPLLFSHSGWLWWGTSRATDSRGVITRPVFCCLLCVDFVVIIMDCSISNTVTVP
jgi:hypothetical protein